MIYLDNSATTALSAAALAKIAEAAEKFGNPSSVHAAGIEAAALVKEGRNAVFDAFSLPVSRRVDGSLPMGAGARDAYRFIFTSCGSEADNMTVFGLLHAKKFRETPRIITTDSEHPAMLESISAAVRSGLCEAVYLSTKGGVIDLSELDGALTPNTLLVSVMTVNNETGALYDIKKIFAAVKKKVPTAVCHTDAVQGFLKTKTDFIRSGADIVTVSGHKIGAPKGIGGMLVSNALLISKRLSPLVYGGGQEGGLRSGTENVIGIAAMGAAAAYEKANLEENIGKYRKLREIFENRLNSLCENSAVPISARINKPENFSDHIISLTVSGVRSETLVRALSGDGICISNGSACSSHKAKKGGVLESFGLSRDDADSTVRISLCGGNTESDMIAAADAIAAHAATLTRKQ